MDTLFLYLCSDLNQPWIKGTESYGEGSQPSIEMMKASSNEVKSLTNLQRAFNKATSIMQTDARPRLHNDELYPPTMILFLYLVCLFLFASVMSGLISVSIFMKSDNILSYFWSVCSCFSCLCRCLS